MIGRINIKIPALPGLIDRTRRAIREWRTWSQPSLADAQRIMREAAIAGMSSGGYPGRKWTPRSAVSTRLRPTGGLENLIPLIRENLSVSTAQLRLDLAGGKLLQEGGTTAAGSMIGGKRVPARPLLLIPDQAAESITAIFMRDLREKLLR